MFVHRSRRSTQGALATAALLGIGLLSACDDPVANTDLRPEGPPEVLSVLVMNDPVDFFFETATFCKTGDAKRPGLVAAGLTFTPLQVCPADLSQPAGTIVVDDAGNETFVPGGVEDAVAIGWYARIMFDELLDPDVEDLIPILVDDDGNPETPDVESGQFTGSLAATQPVILRCTAPGSTTAVEIEYDGYYSPSGNAVTWPLGPSLFIQPVDHSTVATGSTCSVEIKNTVVDKQGESVPAGGTFEWNVEALAFAGTSPAEAAPGEEEAIAVDAPVIVSFNAFIDAATLAPAEVEIREGAAADTDCANVTANGTVRAAVVAADAADPLSLNISIAGNWVAGRMYAVTFLANEVADLAGGPGSIPESTVCFLAE